MDRSIRQFMDPVRWGVHGLGVSVFGSPLLKTMLNRAFKLSSNWQFFHQECERLKMVFARLRYPETLIENTIRNFIEMRVTKNMCSKQQVSDEQDAPIRIVLPFKDQKSANVVRHQLSDLSRKIN